MHVECAPCAPEGAPAEGGVYRNRIWGTWPPNLSAGLPAPPLGARPDMTSIGLVLGAGGAVGHAYHAGGLSAIEDATGWRAGSAAVIAGTSAGSIVAAPVPAGCSSPCPAAGSLGKPPAPTRRAPVR